MTSIEIAAWVSAGANVVIAGCAVFALFKFSGNKASHGSSITQGDGNATAINYDKK